VHYAGLEHFIWLSVIPIIANGAVNANNRPRKADTIQIWLGLIVNLVGSLLTILGAAVLAFLLLNLSLPQGLGAALTLTRSFRPVDIFCGTANTNTVAATLLISGLLWLLNRVNRQ